MEMETMSPNQQNHNESPELKSRIIVDEDWKSQVEREKEALRQQQSDAGEPSAADSPILPAASFALLVSTFTTQALAAMGLLADPETGQPVVERSLAKHFIDLLGVLEEKTQGNLSVEEQNQLREDLHQLRMIYVATANQTPSDSPVQSAKPGSPIIQLP
jgi:hypothetical protein